jgi:pimeloyl-ACP methyl ester carboxylesterase
MSEEAPPVKKARSADGTLIAYERFGDGPPIILVGGALTSALRSFRPFVDLAQALSSTFTVYTYDRRGRGDSGDTQPYAVDREIDDLEALIAEAGGSARRPRPVLRWDSRPRCDRSRCCDHETCAVRASASHRRG